MAISHCYDQIPDSSNLGVYFTLCLQRSLVYYSRAGMEDCSVNSGRDLGSGSDIVGGQEAASRTRGMDNLWWLFIVTHSYWPGPALWRLCDLSRACHTCGNKSLNLSLWDQSSHLHSGVFKRNVNWSEVHCAKISKVENVGRCWRWSVTLESVFPIGHVCFLDPSVAFSGRQYQWQQYSFSD